jgi:hypothetical protein
MKYLILAFAFTFLSCGSRGECDVEQISKNVFDSIYVKGDFIMENQKHETDTLKIKDYFEIFATYENIGPMVHDECGHFINYSYEFKEEIINVDIEKNETKLIFKAESLHMSNEYQCDKNLNFYNQILVVNGKYCEQSIFDKIGFKNFKIEYILTKNGDKWLPKKFILKKTM